MAAEDKWRGRGGARGGDGRSGVLAAAISFHCNSIGKNFLLFEAKLVRQNFLAATQQQQTPPDRAQHLHLFPVFGTRAIPLMRPYRRPSLEPANQPPSLLFPPHSLVHQAGDQGTREQGQGSRAQGSKDRNRRRNPPRPGRKGQASDRASHTRARYSLIKQTTKSKGETKRVRPATAISARGKLADILPDAQTQSRFFIIKCSRPPRRPSRTNGASRPT